MDGLLALDHSDSVGQVLHSPQSYKKPSIRAFGNGSEIPRVQLKDKNPRAHPTASGNGRKSVDQLTQADHVPSNTHSSQGDSKMYIFEDNEVME